MPRTKRGTCNQFSATGTCAYGASCRFSHRRDPNAHNPLESFFEGYDGFEYDPSEPAWDEFHRLARYVHWSKEERSDQRDAFKDALVQAFNNIYGTDENNLASWATLCDVLNISPIPEGLDNCRKAVKAVFVNLVDLVDLPNSERPLQLFDSEAELSEYTLENDKIFPKENAYAGGLLRHLLRKIMNPGERRMPGIPSSRRRRRR